MTIALVQSNTGTAATATVNPSFVTAPTAGNLIVLCISADDANGTPDSGWTQSTGMAQQTFSDTYIWWRISDGSNPPGSYTIASATNSAWVMAEFSGISASPYDISAGHFAQSSGQTYTTLSITPTSGDRLLIAGLGGSASSSLAAQTWGSWTNSFTAIGSIGSGGSGTNDVAGLAYQIVTGGNGTTAYSSGGTCTAVLQSRVGLIIAFKSGSATEQALAGSTMLANIAKPAIIGSVPVAATVSTKTFGIASGVYESILGAKAAVAAMAKAALGSTPSQTLTEIQKNGGGSAASANIVTSLPGPTTAGNSILLFAQGAGTITTPAGFVSRSPQVNAQGLYLFERLTALGDASDTPTLVMGGPYNATWLIVEYSGLSAYDTSAGNNAVSVSDGNPVAFQSITPASGNKLLVACLGVSTGNPGTYSAGDPKNWTGSFSGEQSVAQTGAVGAGLDSLVQGWASREVIASGSTPYTTTATFDSLSSHTGSPATIIAAYTAVSASGVQALAGLLGITSRIAVANAGGASLSARTAMTITARPSIIAGVKLMVQSLIFPQLSASFRPEKALAGALTLANHTKAAVRGMTSISGVISIKDHAGATPKGLAGLTARTAMDLTARLLHSGIVALSMPVSRLTMTAKASASGIGSSALSAATKIKVSAKTTPANILALMAHLATMVKLLAGKSARASVSAATELKVAASPVISGGAKLAARSPVAIRPTAAASLASRLAARVVLIAKARGPISAKAAMAASVSAAVSSVGRLSGLLAMVAATRVTITMEAVSSVLTPHIALAARMTAAVFSKAFAFLPSRSSAAAHRKSRTVVAPPRRNNED